MPNDLEPAALETKPLLSNEARDQFVNDLKGLPAEPAAPSVPSANVPAGGALPASDPANPGGTTPPPEPGAVPPGTESGQPSADLPKGPIPYERFHEVNEKFKAADQRARDLEAKQEEAGRAHAISLLEQIAQENPDLRAAIYGEPKADPAAPAPAPVPGAPPQNPLEAQIQALTKRVQSQDEYLRGQRRQEVLNALEERADARMQTHPVFKDPETRSVGERLIAARVQANPKDPVEKVVDTVADELRKYEEKIKAKYVTTKVADSKAIVPGVGGGSAAPPGRPPEKLSMQDGSARKAFERDLKALMGQT